MFKRTIKICFYIFFAFNFGIQGLNAQGVLDSNCEKLKYQPSWPNYSTWHKGKFNTTYLLDETTISCRKSDMDSCVVVRADSSVSMDWTSLKNLKNISSPEQWNKYKGYENDYQTLKAFRDNVENGKITVTGPNDDRYTSKDPASRIILSKIQSHPTATIFNWFVISEAYKYIVEKINNGVLDDIKNDRSFSPTRLKAPKDWDTAQNNSCAKKIFKKYQKKETITIDDLNDCFAFQAYCTENFAMYGVQRDINKLVATYNDCNDVLRSQLAPKSKYSDTRIKGCRETFKPDNINNIQNNLKDLDLITKKFNSIASTQLPGTADYFKKLREQYQKVANNMTALIEQTGKELQQEYRSRQKYNELTAISNSCAQAMVEADKKDPYTSAIQQYAKEYPLVSAYSGITYEKQHDMDKIVKQYSKQNDPGLWNDDKGTALRNICTGILDVAKNTITAAKEKNKQAMLNYEQREYEVIAQVWNKTINQINELCTPGTYKEKYNSNNTMQAENAEALDDLSEDMQRKLNEQMPQDETNLQAPVEAEGNFAPQVGMDQNKKIDPEKLETAKKLFDSLLSPVIEYNTEAAGGPSYLSNPIPRLMNSRGFMNNSGLKNITHDFTATCESAYEYAHKYNVPNKLSRIFNILSEKGLYLYDKSIIEDMDGALAKIEKDRNNICLYSNPNPEYLADGTGYDPINNSRVKLISKYLSFTPGIFQEYISQNPHPISCAILSAAYSNDQFNKTIKPLLGAANIGLFVGSLVHFVPLVAIPCRVGLVMVSFADAGISINNISDQTEMAVFADNAVKAGFIDYKAGDQINEQADNSIFWNYISLGTDALFMYSGAKGLKILNPAKEAAAVNEAVSTATQKIPSFISPFDVGQTATTVGEVGTPLFKLPLGFKNALAKFYGYAALYTGLTLGSFVEAPLKILTQTEQVAKIGVSVTEAAASESTFVVQAIQNGSKLASSSAAKAGSFISDLGGTISNVDTTASMLTATSKVAPQAFIINGQFLSQVIPVSIGSGAASAFGYKIITAIDGYAYTNYFLNKDGTVVRLSQLSKDKSIANTEGGMGDKNTFDGNEVIADVQTQQTIDELISDYKRYCAGTI